MDKQTDDGDHDKTVLTITSDGKSYVHVKYWRFP